MRRPPRSPKEQVLTGRMIVLVVIASLLIGGATLVVYQTERNLDATYAQAQTAAVTMLALAQLAFLFNARFLNSSSLTPRVLVGNRAIWIGAAVLLVLQIAFAYAPFMNNWFGSAPIGLRDWGISLGLAILVFLLAEAGKTLVRRTAPARSTR